MPVKNLALAPIQWLAYFNEQPDLFQELVACRLDLQEAGMAADKAADRKAALTKVMDLLQPRLDELEQFQRTFTKRPSKLSTELELKQELVHVYRGNATTVARASGASTMQELAAAERERLDSKPKQAAGQSEADYSKAVAEWQVEQEALKSEAARSSDGNEAAAQKLAEEMNTKFTLEQVDEVIKLANQSLSFLTSTP